VLTGHRSTQSCTLSIPTASLHKRALSGFSSPHTYGRLHASSSQLESDELTSGQLIPDEIQYDANATPPQFTNNADMVIEPGTHVRCRIIGLRTEVGEMWAIGSINGDFLGYVLMPRFQIATY
jgi:hypothetical protein